MTSYIITIPELGGLLGISVSHCYELAARDELPVPVIRLGRRRVVSRRAVEDLLGGPIADAA
jgi:predicted DNA-binding transcriptional regulator AlpA